MILHYIPYTDNAYTIIYSDICIQRRNQQLSPLNAGSIDARCQVSVIQKVNGVYFMECAGVWSQALTCYREDHHLRGSAEPKRLQRVCTAFHSSVNTFPPDNEVQIGLFPNAFLRWSNTHTCF